MSNVIREEDTPEPAPQKQIIKKGRSYLMQYTLGKREITENIGQVSFPEAKRMLKQRIRASNGIARNMVEEEMD